MKRFMKSVNCSKTGNTSVTCSKISNIPSNLIFTTKFNDSSILITIISWDYLNLSLANEYVGDITILTQVIKYNQFFSRWISQSDCSIQIKLNKMNCELMLTYDTPALRQTGSRNLTDQKMLPTIWGTYMKLVTTYQISAINSCWEKCDEKYLWTDGRTNRGKTVYLPPLRWSGGIIIGVISLWGDKFKSQKGSNK